LESEECPLSSCLLRLLQCASRIGTCTKKIAKALSLSTDTVNTYWKRIKHALGVEERHQAIELARKNGWLDLPLEEVPNAGGGLEMSHFWDMTDA
jgi:ATP/maltotriose-dependent transcriptional regulator MalT